MWQIAEDSYAQGQIDVLDTLIETWDEMVAKLRAAGEVTVDPVALLTAMRDGIRYERDHRRVD